MVIVARVPPSGIAVVVAGLLARVTVVELLAGSWSSEGLGQGQEGPWMGASEGLEWVQDVQSAAEKRDPSTLTDRLVFWASHVGPLRLIPTFLAKRTE